MCEIQDAAHTAVTERLLNGLPMNHRTGKGLTDQNSVGSCAKVKKSEKFSLI